MNIVLLGLPGTGKGTQARALSAKLGLTHVSFGDIYWNEIGKKSILGHEVTDYLRAGKPVPDWLVLNTLKERFAAEKKGLVMDGFPRSTEQADDLETWLSSRSSRLTAAIALKISETEALKRAEGRRVCRGCGAIFNTVTMPPAKENICDLCGGPLQLREDDNPSAMRNRIMSHKDQTEPLIVYYRGSADFLEVDGAQPPQAVTDRILAFLGTLKGL
ncbi:MAG TPA: nucleoside monophosphate kinase [Elusimicrobiales bacterium]|nr:nucleoside monophosphate kinase [Elusimicrobiales bacterium]